MSLISVFLREITLFHIAKVIIFLFLLQDLVDISLKH